MVICLHHLTYFLPLLFPSGLKTHSSTWQQEQTKKYRTHTFPSSLKSISCKKFRLKSWKTCNVFLLCLRRLVTALNQMTECRFFPDKNFLSVSNKISSQLHHNLEPPMFILICTSCCRILLRTILLAKDYFRDSAQ